MKTIIISDIRSSSNSVIPYGLSLSASMNSAAVVIHVVDPRVTQAKYSSYSDSQSLTPGEPMGHDETSNKETGIITTELENFLSREVSRQNFPLKVDALVKRGNLEEEIEKLIAEEPSCLIVASSEPDGTLFEDKDDLYDLVKDSKAMFILVPPGTEFREYKKILHPVDFDSKELDKYSDLRFFFEEFDPVINAVAVGTDKEYVELELKSNSWAKVARDTFLPAKIRTNVLKGDEFVETVVNYSNRNEHDLIMLFQYRKNPFQKNFRTAMIGAIIERTNIPVLYFYRK